MRIAVLALLFAAAACNGKGIRLGGGVDGSDGDAGSDGEACSKSPVPASQVLWIGDSWVTPASAKRVQELARAADAIGASDVYAFKAIGAKNMAQIADQYRTQEASATKVKVLIMDGGGWDIIVSGGSDAIITGVGQTFQQLLADIARDGTVTHIIYIFYPALAPVPALPGLRPVMQQACEASRVPCHFLDLQQWWAGHPEYTASNTYDPSDAGSTVIAEQIWATMRQYCIAQ